MGIQPDTGKTGTDARPSQLSNAELLRRGIHLSQKTQVQNHNRKAQAALPDDCSNDLAELEELREEWRRRFPRFPLSITFG